MDIKETNYVTLIMETHGALDHLEGPGTQQRYKGSGGELVTKIFNYCEVFGDHFNYIHQVDNNNNRCHYPIQFRVLGLQSIVPTRVMPTSWH